MLKILILLSIVLFIDCAGPSSNRTSKRKLNKPDELMFVYRALGLKYAAWVLDEKFQGFASYQAYLKKYNVPEYLKECSIHLNGVYKFNDIHACIAKYIEKVFRVQCHVHKNSEDKKQYFSEVHLCFNSNLQLTYDIDKGVLVDCIGDGENPCDREKDIFYEVYE